MTPASLWRRAAADGIDTLPFAIVIGVVVARKVRRGQTFSFPQWAAVAVQVVSLLETSWLVAERGGTPGQRLLGLRVVDVATGNNLSFTRALLRASVRSPVSLFQVVIGRRRLDALRGRRNQALQRMADLQPRLTELQEEYSDDPKQLSDAVEALYREHAINPLQGCLDPVAIVAILYSLATYVAALRSPRRQAIHDHLAQAVVIQTK
jgi:uncharacterized RDD family membrane protein YckC